MILPLMLYNCSGANFSVKKLIYLYHICIYVDIKDIGGVHGGACGVMVIVVGNGHGDTSSNPGRD